MAVDVCASVLLPHVCWSTSDIPVAQGAEYRALGISAVFHGGSSGVGDSNPSVKTLLTFRLWGG